jgi:hypothetical protein
MGTPPRNCESAPLSRSSRFQLLSFRAQRKNNEGVLGVISGLHRVIPVIEHID